MGVVNANAGAGADDPSVGSVAWTTPGNVTANDGVRTGATGLNSGSSSHYLYSNTFNLNLPANARLQGIIVAIERRQSAASSIRDAVVSLGDASGPFAEGDNKANLSLNWPTTDTIRNYGSSTDFWNLSAAHRLASVINASGFGVYLQATNPGNSSSAQVDVVTVTEVYWDYAVPIGQAVGVGTALSITPSIQRLNNIGLAQSANVAQTITPVKRPAISMANETDTAQPISTSRTLIASIGQAVSSNQALNISPPGSFPKQVPIGMAESFNSAFSIDSGARSPRHHDLAQRRINVNRR